MTPLTDKQQEKAKQTGEAITNFVKKADMIEAMVKADAIDPGLPLAIAFSGKPRKDIERLQETTEFMEKTQPKLAKYMRDIWDKHGENVRALNRAKRRRTLIAITPPL